MALRIEVLDCLRYTGPNIHCDWPALQWTIDLGALETKPTNELPGFACRLEALIPSLIDHHCSEAARGGFLRRVEDGTWLGHVMEHIAIELQNLAGACLSFGRTRSAGNEGTYDVVYECEDVAVGTEAGRIAIELIHALIEDRPIDVRREVDSLATLRREKLLGPSGQAIVDAATHRGIPFIRLNDGNFVQLGYGAHARRIQATTTSLTQHHAVEIAGDKALTKKLLAEHGVPVPVGETCETVDQAMAIAKRIGYPVAVKPLDASKGRGIVTNVQTQRELAHAVREAKRYRSTILVEKHVPGNDYRFLVIHRKLVAVAHRIPARVTGDGEHTIAELVEIENRDPRRGRGHENLLTIIEIDDMTKHLLGLRGLEPASIPPAGARVYLKTTANLSTGGFAIDVTDEVHPDNARLAERIAALVGLDIAGIDVIAPCVDRPFAQVEGAIVEVNAAPGFRMHLAPTEGTPRAVGDALIEMLFPDGTESRIPIITITGTNGKTTTTRLCAHIAANAGYQVGFSTTDGIYVGSERVVAGDCTGPSSARVVLTEAEVGFAVLETARGGILRAGLGYDWANVAVVTNIAADHLGARGVETLDDLARVKGLTIARVFPDGYAVLNADDAMTPRLLERARCKIALFALDRWNELFGEHVTDGGIGVTLESGEITLYQDGARIGLGRIDQVPLTFGGRARFNAANTLAAIAATYCAGIGLHAINTAILSFEPSAVQTPGRMNAIDVGGVTVILDYAHNAHGLASVAQFVGRTAKNRAIAIVGVPGDRRDEDIVASGRAVAKAFDLVIVREDFDLRGRAPGENAELLRQGLVDGGCAVERIAVVPNEAEAVRFALRFAQSGDLVVYFADEIERAATLLEEHRSSRTSTASNAIA